MSLDPHSLERLRELGRQLPKALPTPKFIPTPDSKGTSGLHRIETEEDPQALFRELMEASPDGRVPPHLISRLKDIETMQQLHAKRQLTNNQTQDIAIDSSSKTNNSHQLKRQKSRLDKTNDEENLYISFQRFLLEEEEI